MIKQTLAALALAATTFIAAPAAEATECTRGQGYTLCYTHISTNGQYNRWHLELTNAHTTERMNVTCFGKTVDTWNSNGGFNQAEAEYLAETFCAV